MPRYTLPEKLRAMRQRCQLTQQQVADILTVDRSTYTYYETGKTTPDIHTLKALAAIYKVSLEDMVDDDPQPSFLHDFGSFPKTPLSPAPENTQSMADLTAEERELIARFRILRASQQEDLLKEAQQLTHDAMQDL